MWFSKGITANIYAFTLSLKVNRKFWVNNRRFRRLKKYKFSMHFIVKKKPQYLTAIQKCSKRPRLNQLSCGCTKIQKTRLKIIVIDIFLMGNCGYKLYSLVILIDILKDYFFRMWKPTAPFTHLHYRCVHFRNFRTTFERQKHIIVA